MAQADTRTTRSLIARDDQPLIGIIERQNGRDVVRYFTDEAAADAAITNDAPRAALAVIGAWSDLDWDQTIEALERIRHDSGPTAPIDDL